MPNPYRLIKGAVAIILKLADGAAGWGDAAVIIPWALYWAYGDMQLLESQYESMKAWVDLYAQTGQADKLVKETQPTILDQTGPIAPGSSLIWDTGYHWGEWLEPGEGDPISMFFGIDQTGAVREPVGSNSLLRQFGAHPGKNGQAAGQEPRMPRNTMRWLNR